MATNVIAVSALSLQLLLPAFNDFAQRAGLDMRLPLNEKRVTKSVAGKNQPSFMAVFDGHHQFNWHSEPDAIHRGRLSYYDNSNSISRLDGPKRRDLAGRVSLISTNEALAIALACLKNLGYDLAKLDATPPRVKQFTFLEEKRDAEPQPLPAFIIEWNKKIKDGEEPHWSDLLIDVEVSGLTKKVTMLTSFRAAAPATGVDLRQFGTNRVNKVIK